ncbi:MAG: hypothetical protein RIR51_2173 [Bacteroidota bacterium]|jgi:hypothetical protein
MKKYVRIGSGAGFSGDRIEPAIELAQKANLDYLVLECLAERTIALAQERKLKDSNLGFDPLLEERLVPLLPLVKEKGFRIITNMGAANPIAAAKKLKELSIHFGLDLKILAIEGDDVLDYIQSNKQKIVLFEKEINLVDLDLVSANAYLGIEGILEGLKLEADIIITGRTADPSLFLAPLVHEFNWNLKNWDLLSKGTVIGHLLECAGQLTGGYFADGVNKKVPNLVKLGFPFAEVESDGKAVFKKLPDSGGILNLQTVKEQLLYEVVDPYHYLTPDVDADFTSIKIVDRGNDTVELVEAKGNAQPENLKVSIGFRGGYLGTGEISYGGPYALESGKLAKDILEKRFSSKLNDFKIDLIGYNSLFPDNETSSIPSEIRLRAVGKSFDKNIAEFIGREVEALYTNGPAGGGGVTKSTKEIIGIVSCLIPRKNIQPKITIL